MVIQELDYIKDGRSGGKQLQVNARAAIKFINNALSQPNSNLKGLFLMTCFFALIAFIKLAGQSVLDASKCNANSRGPDDMILSCCMQVLQNGNKAVSMFVILIHICVDSHTEYFMLAICYFELTLRLNTLSSVVLKYFKSSYYFWLYGKLVPFLLFYTECSSTSLVFEFSINLQFS